MRLVLKRQVRAFRNVSGQQLKPVEEHLSQCPARKERAARPERPLSEPIFGCRASQQTAAFRPLLRPGSLVSIGPNRHRADLRNGPSCRECRNANFVPFEVRASGPPGRRASRSGLKQGSNRDLTGRQRGSLRKHFRAPRSQEDNGAALQVGCITADTGRPDVWHSRFHVLFEERRLNACPQSCSTRPKGPPQQ